MGRVTQGRTLALALAVAVWLSGCTVTVHTEDHVRVTAGDVHVFMCYRTGDAE